MKLTGEQILKARKLRGAGPEAAGGSQMGVDELQGLLLQISFAIMMVFMMAYFLFRSDTRRRQEEQLLELERQKLVLAADAVERESLDRFGLDATAGLDFESDVPFFLEGDGLTSEPVLRAAFLKASGEGAAAAANPLELRRGWIDRVCSLAGMAYGDLSRQSADWLSQEADAAAARYAEGVGRLRYRAAAELQRYWMDNLDTIDDPGVTRILSELDGAGDDRRLLLVSELSAVLKSRALERLDRLAGQGAGARKTGGEND